MRPAVLWSVAVAFCALASPIARADYCGPGPNLADLDIDGLPDYACVGDWDDDGILEMKDDLQAAIDALADPDAKLVELTDGIFTPPLFVGYGNGIVNVPSRTTIVGRGAGLTVLRGFPASDTTSRERVITNADHAMGNSDIVLSDFELDGGWTGGNGDFAHERRGIALSACTDCIVERVTIRDTLHACIYSRNSTNLILRDNVLHDCGNYSGTGPTYACVYLFADPGMTMENTDVLRNSCQRSGGAGISLRRQDTTATVRDVSIVENTITDTRDQSSACMILRGAETVSVTGGNLCERTGGVQTQDVDAYDALYAVRDLTLEDLTIRDSGPGPAGLLLSDYIDGLTIRDVEVDGTPAAVPCAKLKNPLRNAIFEDLTLRNCGGDGLAEASAYGSGNELDERLSFTRLTVDGVDDDGLIFYGAAAGLLLDELTLRNVPSDAVRFSASVHDSTIRATLEDVTGHGIRIAAGSTNVAVTDSALSRVGGDGLRLEGAGHTDISILRTGFFDIAGRGVASALGPTTVTGLQISDNTFDGIDNEAVELLLSAGSPSTVVEISRNVLRDFSRLPAWPNSMRGIDLSGAISGEIVADNMLEDLLDQAQHGVHVDLQGIPAASHLCSNTCSGTLTSLECIRVVGDTGYETDLDVDGIVDACEACVDDPDNDGDGDGLCAGADNCPEIANAGQEDVDADGIGDVCDNCPDTGNPGQVDQDGDTWGDLCDNCVLLANTDQRDRDDDFEGDHCDLDDGLIFLTLPDRSLVEWQLESGFDSWNLYRGDLDVLRVQGLYSQEPGSNPAARQECGLAAAFLPDPDEPPPGKTAFYLVTGVNVLGEDGLGPDSQNVERPHDNPCPAVP